MVHISTIIIPLQATKPSTHMAVFEVCLLSIPGLLFPLILQRFYPQYQLLQDFCLFSGRFWTLSTANDQLREIKTGLPPQLETGRRKLTPSLIKPEALSHVWAVYTYGSYWTESQGFLFVDHFDWARYTSLKKAERKKSSECTCGASIFQVSRMTT